MGKRLDRDSKGCFVKGFSGNPGGRSRIEKEIRMAQLENHKRFLEAFDKSECLELFAKNLIDCAKRQPPNRTSLRATKLLWSYIQRCPICRTRLMAKRIVQ